MQEEERYLGGSYSPLQLSIGRFGVGAGVYEERLQAPFRTGYLKIISASGETVEVRIGKKKEYEWLVRPLQSFESEMLRIL